MSEKNENHLNMETFCHIFLNIYLKDETTWMHVNSRSSKAFICPFILMYNLKVWIVYP